MDGKIDSNWEEIYALYDGEMPGCTKEKCLHQCCRTKTLQIPGIESRSFTTMFFNEGEKTFQQGLSPSLDQLGITTETIKTILNRPDILTIVDNCFDPKQGCKLKERKPIVCRMYPFYHMVEAPVDEDCPRRMDFFTNPIIRENVLKIRRALGFTDNERWLHSAYLGCEEFHFC